jgi:hypothetical protein
MKAGGGKEEEVSGRRPTVETVARGEARGRKSYEITWFPIARRVYDHFETN